MCSVVSVESNLLLGSQYFKGHMLPTNLQLVKIEFFNSPFSLEQCFHVIEHSEGYPLAMLHNARQRKTL